MDWPNSKREYKGIPVYDKIESLVDKDKDDWLFHFDFIVNTTKLEDFDKLLTQKQPEYIFFLVDPISRAIKDKKGVVNYKHIGDKVSLCARNEKEDIIKSAIDALPDWLKSSFKELFVTTEDRFKKWFDWLQVIDKKTGIIDPDRDHYRKFFEEGKTPRECYDVHFFKSNKEEPKLKLIEEKT